MNFRSRGKWIVLDNGDLCPVPAVMPPAICCRISDDGVFGSSGSWRFHYLISVGDLLAAVMGHHVMEQQIHIHKVDSPSLQRPLGIIRGKRGACLDEERHEDLSAIEQPSNFRVSQRAGPDLKVSIPRNIAVHQLARGFEIFGSLIL
jgi:hypothetical protein